MSNIKTYAKAIRITDDCINCGACEIECPVNAVKTAPHYSYINNNFIFNRYTSSVHFYIDQYQCNNCAGSFSSPRCNDVCPVACCITEEEINNNVPGQSDLPSNLDLSTKFSENNQLSKLNTLLFSNISLN